MPTPGTSDGAPFCLSLINGLLVDCLIVSFLLKARLLSSGGIPGHQPICFHLHAEGKAACAKLHPAPLDSRARA